MFDLSQLSALDQSAGPMEIVSLPQPEPLTVPDHLGVDHFAAFPQEWPRRLILGWSPEGGLILDEHDGAHFLATTVEDALQRRAPALEPIAPHHGILPVARRRANA